LDEGNRMRFALILVIVLFPGCAQLKQGQLQPVVPEAEGAYFTTCSGSVEDWGSCYRKANTTCKNGYETLHKFESAVGGRREFKFSCYK